MRMVRSPGRDGGPNGRTPRPAWLARRTYSTFACRPSGPRTRGAAMPLTLLLVALIPALTVLFYYYHRDRHPEPWGWVALVFAAGALSCLVALPLERWAQSLIPAPSGPGGPLFLECLLIPGLIEESVKLLVVLAVIFWRPEFDEPVDGLVYGIAAALGFTFAEDWYHSLLHGPDWTRLLSAVAHPWFSCFW